MSEQPPAELVATLERLGLASGAQVARMGRRVRRLAGDLPRFESVWIDALVQARMLTPFQAAEINAGRGERLRVGPYVLYERMSHPYYVACYSARNVDTQERARLAVGENATPQPAPVSPHSPFLVVGVDAARLFAATPWLDGRTAAEWMVHHGRFPPEIVLEIARGMLDGLVELENAGACHGDVSTSSLLLTETGDVALMLPGLRGILRPEEGYAHADLPPEAYDSLAPERVAVGTAPDGPSDVYACGCVWWQLLCGRPALAGGSSLEKLRAAQGGEICDVRQYAPDTPAVLVGAISACLTREPSRRPDLARLAAMLGPPTRSGKESLAECLARAGRPTVGWTTTARSIRRSNRTPLWIAATVCCLAAAVAILWPTRQSTVGSRQWAVDVRQRAEGGGRRAERIDSPNLPTSQSPNLQVPASTSLVVPAAYRQIEEKPAELVLAADKPVDATAIIFRAGQRVRGPSGKRAEVVVTRSGLVVDKENVQFENIDFVWRSTAAVDDARSAEPVIVELLASRAEFRGCSFVYEEAGAVLPAAVSAIHWVHPTPTDGADTALPSGRLRLTDCVLRQVGVGVDCRTAGALNIELRNVLHVDAGPLVRLDHCPRSDEPLSLLLKQVTLRGGGPLLECLSPGVVGQPGEITVLATACAFVPGPGVPLVSFVATLAEKTRTGTSPHADVLGPNYTGSEPVSVFSARLPEAVRWSGQGSLVAVQSPIVAWRGPDSRQQVVDESSLVIAGLVRSGVGFAGEASGDPAASRLLRWQAPLQSADPPGIDPAALPGRNGITD